MRQKISLDENWLFHRGDIIRKRPTSKGPIYTGAKTVRERWGAASYDYNDDPDDYRQGVEYNSDRWERVSLPHDFVIEGEFDEQENNTLGFLKYDNAWYRRHFRLNEDDKGKRITLYFEGVSGQSAIYVNGCPLYHNFSGYTSFEVDITDFVLFDKDNIIAVYIDSTHHESWWYEGGGIYRHVWLVKSAPVCVDLWGVYIRPKKVSETDWRTDISVTVKNTTSAEVNAIVKTELYDENGTKAGECSTECTLEARRDATVNLGTSVKNPILWQVGDGHLYTAVTTVIMDGEEVDRVSDRYGYREVVCDPNHGLFVNGRHEKICGVCGHYDCGLVGKAVPDSIFRYKVKLLTEMGANGYRTSHYPQSEALMDALDDAGFIVLDEIRWFTSSKEGMEQLEMLIKRDRNRPSVFFWCIGNEEMLFAEERGRRILESLLARTRQLDATRPVTAACDRPDNSTVYDNLDVVGINYGLDSYDAVHKKFPDRAVVSTECCATSTTRGWYYDDFPAMGLTNCYDRDWSDWFRGRERTWKFIDEREWVMGSYQWIGFDHRGETVWPRLSSCSGAIDMFLLKKDAFWHNKALWTRKPMIHLLPHWNHPGHEGEIIKVWAYTNCDSAELFVDGVSRGKVELQPHDHAAWEVEYHPGKIEVVGYKDGRECCRDAHETTTAPVKLMLRCETPDVKAGDTAVFTCYTLDSEGREVPTADPTVRFVVNKLGVISGTGSAVYDHEPVKSNIRRMYAGQISAAVKCTGKGTLALYAYADGLEAASVYVDVK